MPATFGPARLWRTCIGVALAAGAVAGHAATVRITFDRNIFEGLTAPAYDDVRIRYPAASGSNVLTSTVRAGRFQGTASNVIGVDPGIFVDNLQDVFMYCYDLYEGVSGGRVVDYTINLDGESARTLDFLGAVNAVLNGQRGTADTFAWLHPANGNEAAAIQIGIWESRYESTGAWSVVDGSFSATELAAGTASTLASFFARIADAESLDARYAMVLEARGAQDMLAGDPPVGVPSPSPAALLLVGAAALVLRRRQASCRSRSCSTS